MVKLKANWILLFVLPVVLFACGMEREVELQYEIKVALDGVPADQSRVLVDGEEAGSTDESGTLSGTIKRMPGAEVRISVVREAPGYEIEPWDGSFKVEKPEKGAVARHIVEVSLKSTKHFTIRVTEKGEAVGGASVRIDGQEATDTDAGGEVFHEYGGEPARQFDIQVEKKGYVTWKRSLEVQPGQVVEAAVHRPSVLNVVALTEENGQERPLAGVEVAVGKKALGKTGDDGTVNYVYRGAPGKVFWVTMTVPGHVPSVWKTKVVLDGRRTVKRYFYSVEPEPIRAGIYGYSGNEPDSDLTPILDRVEEAVGNVLFSHMIFDEVPPETLRERIKESDTDIETMTDRGWRDTSLIGTLDAVIVGSVSRDDRGYVVETKVHTPDGRLVLSQISPARGEKDVKDVAKKVAREVMEHFPFQGTVISEREGDVRINLGKSDHQLKKGMEFALMSPVLDRQGKVADMHDIGTLRISKVERAGSWGKVVEIQGGQSAKPGQRVVRRILTEGDSLASGHSLTLQAKGGVPPDVDPLPGVNVYLDERWVGTTGTDGRTRIPAKVGRTYGLHLYRHGYQPWTGEVRAEEDGEDREFVLEVNNSLFKLDSQPSGARVYIDGTMVGRTPIVEGRQVPFGFHTVRVSAGGNYRDWQEVVEFNRKSVDLSGTSRINLVVDYLAMGKRAEQERDLDAAMDAYTSAERDHPDYSDARFRLAQLYMDEKGDYAAAVREFENILSLPENRELIYKQYSVAYTNLGHAYYEMGSGMVLEDREGASQNFALAIENLEKAKQYTRFFPTQQYHEALHDTHYYLARSYHRLYLTTRKDTLLGKADQAWRDYFDFFPKDLEEVGEFAQLRDSAEKHWTQIQDLM
ncbi:MAG: PEGA domain-containing protein [bacterium]|nr:MAG: PEGA domain-containing protein [bacterium]